MRPTPLLFCAAAAALSLSHAADLSGDPSGLWKPVAAIYKVHSGDIADRAPATTNDRALTIHIDGKAAKDIFESMGGPDDPPTCVQEKGDRERRRKGLYCTYTASDVRDKDGPYRCWVGVNLRTGDSTPTIGC